jgi:hypothetical protein
METVVTVAPALPGSRWKRTCRRRPRKSAAIQQRRINGRMAAVGGLDSGRSPGTIRRRCEDP